MLKKTHNYFRVLYGIMMMISRISRTSAFVLPRIRGPVVSSFGASTVRTETTVAIYYDGGRLLPNSLAASRTRLFSATTAAAEEGSTKTTSQVPPLKRVKTIDAVDPTDDPVVIKGWVRTIRKQKTLAFVQVNDGSTLKGIQCVVSFDDIDENSKTGACLYEYYT